MISVSSGVNPEGKPFCYLEWGGEKGQLTPEEARTFALTLLAAAEAAEMDSSVFLWLDKMGLTLPERAQAIGGLRDFRGQARKLSGDAKEESQE